mmetsp:Transcript_30631/g.48001  ORF Transcript_30631/g.48001 Transcript_30631/m.48001 type:complete len:99 (+) Transcript_30631:182-478(+)
MERVRHTKQGTRSSGGSPECAGAQVSGLACFARCTWAGVKANLRVEQLQVLLPSAGQSRTRGTGVLSIALSVAYAGCPTYCMAMPACGVKECRPQVTL